VPFAARLLAVLGVFGCGGEPAPPVPSLAVEESPAAGQPSGGELDRYITIIAAGDNLIHDIIYNNARAGTPDAAGGNLAVDNSAAGNRIPLDEFNFDPCYEKIRPVIEEADIAFVNQETVLGGKRFGYSGYPVFNTPQDAGLALINAGFDVVNQASNHTMDRGEAAVFGTMDLWDSRKEILPLGIFRSEEQRRGEKRVIEKNGIKTGFLSYTYGLNGFKLPGDKPWLVALIGQEIMAREIDELRPLCDLLVVSMHWGSEFQHEPSEAQKDLARFMAGRGVDLVLGHHPHVTQPVEIISRPGGGQMVCYYSLGDFLSHTQSDWTPDTMTGALAYVRVRKLSNPPPGRERVSIETAGVIPTVCHYGRERKKPFSVYPLWDYPEDLAARHYKPGITLEYIQETARKVFGSRVMTKEQYLRMARPLSR
jgi:poly-gamma-glutamate synthesis protein (capsule biosynthesis protein)